MTQNRTNPRARSTVAWIAGVASVLGTLGGAPAALAHGGTATITVQNRFDGEADVRIDGRFVGRVGGGATVAYETRSGERSVQVTRPSTGYVLASTNLCLGDGASAVVPVNAPRGTLKVANTGEVKLKLDIERTAVWIDPGTTVQLVVDTGNVELGASIHDPHGDWQAIERTLWVEPGQVASTTLAPDPTVVVITNRDNVPVHALLDGDDAGWIDPGETERVWVRPGRTQVVLLDRAGRVRTTTNVTVTKGNDAKIVVAPTAPPPPTVVVVSSDRPSGRPSYR